MVNYNDGKWHGHNGGECPVHPETVIDVVGFPGLCPRDKASIYNWTSVDSPVVAFRVIKEHKEPREFWVCLGEIFHSEDDARIQYGSGPEIIHVREVIE